LANKEILASLEIINSEIRLIVGEFHNNRLNILKVERIETEGIKGIQIIEERPIIAAIRQALANVKHLLGVDVNAVVLVIPAFDMIKKSVRVNIVSESMIKEKVTMQHFENSLGKLLNTSAEIGYEIVNGVVTRFLTDGVMSRKIPIGEEVNSLAVDVDLLCAKQELVYQYAGIVEKAGLKLLDISMDNYAICKEASLLEQSFNEYIILVRQEEEYTTLSLITQGRIVNCELEMMGTGELLRAIMKKNRLPKPVARKLLLNNCRFQEKSPLETPIYLWSEDGITTSVSEKEIVDEVKPLLQKQVKEFRSLSHQILEQENVSLVLTGEAGSILGIKKFYEEAFDIPVKEYRPESLGIRDSSLAAVSGNFYVYKDQLALRIPRQNSVDVVEFEKTMLEKRKPEEKEDDTLTNRFKGLFDRKAKQ
jgi:Actin-like ATPase involved in cell division